MRFEEHQSNMVSKFSKHTDNELLHLETRLREGGETDAANVCSQILLSRRNRPLLAKDEYPYRRGIGTTEEDFMNIIG